MEKKTISLLGSTGSIGCQSLDVIEKLGYRVSALTANRSVSELEKQARKFRPALVAMREEKAGRDLRVRLSDTAVRVVWGDEGLIEAVSQPESDTVITAVVGMVGLRPTMAAIQSGKRIALANKETLVCAGHLVMSEARRYGAEIIPVDSEHSAIFQSLSAGKQREIKRILLTASGGPFRGKTYEELAAMTRKEALHHPNWSMGQKITIDSATMMNKGLEFIEAMHLFRVKPEQIRVLVHPQSIVHSMVEYCDNAVVAQMGVADMRIPIELALTYPERSGPVAAELDFTKIPPLTFENPDLDAFRCLRLAMEIADRKDAACAVMNGANEAAVGLFLQDKISFNGIYESVAQTVEELGNLPSSSVDEVILADARARQKVTEITAR